MSQQLALLTLYNGLTRNEDREARKRLFEILSTGPAYGDDQRPELRRTIERELRYSDAVAFDDYYWELAERRSDDARQPVLEIQKLELLIAMSKRFHDDGDPQLESLIEEADAEGFRAFVQSLIKDDADDRLEQARQLVRAIDEVARALDDRQHWSGKVCDQIQTSGPYVMHEQETDRPRKAKSGELLVPVLLERPGLPLRRLARIDALDLLESDVEHGEAEPNATDLVLMLLRRDETEVVDELFEQPSVTCVGMLVPVEIDGEGEFATLLQSTTVFPVTTFPTLKIEDFWETLLDPTTWDDKHPFWCSMEPITPSTAEAAIGLPAVDLLANCPGAGSSADHWLIWEKVGFCTDPDPAFHNLFPRTFLCIERRPNHDSTKLVLDYRLVRTAQSYLALDHGQVIVRKKPDAITVTITKTLHLLGLDHQTEGQALAEFACENGWADQTRQLIVNTVLGST